jgi:hypothetical protein
LATEVPFNISIENLSALLTKWRNDAGELIPAIIAQGLPLRERTLAKFTDSWIEEVEKSGEKSVAVPIPFPHV